MYIPYFKPSQPQYNGSEQGCSLATEVHAVVRRAQPCARCWDCRCKAVENLCYSSVRLEKNLTDTEKSLNTTLGLVGIGSKEVSTKLSITMHECKIHETSLAYMKSKVSRDSRKYDKSSSDRI